jgi:hypothetical protein
MVPFFVLSVVGGNTKRKDRVVVADTPTQEALSHNKTTWIVDWLHALRKSTLVYRNYDLVACTKIAVLRRL